MKYTTKGAKSIFILIIPLFLNIQLCSAQIDSIKREEVYGVFHIYRINDFFLLGKKSKLMEDGVHRIVFENNSYDTIHVNKGFHLYRLGSFIGKEVLSISIESGHEYFFKIVHNISDGSQFLIQVTEDFAKKEIKLKQKIKKGIRPKIFSYRLW